MKHTIKRIKKTAMEIIYSNASVTRSICISRDFLLLSDCLHIHLFSL